MDDDLISRRATIEIIRCLRHDTDDADELDKLLYNIANSVVDGAIRAVSAMPSARRAEQMFEQAFNSSPD